jgi:hypothetical protein
MKTASVPLPRDRGRLYFVVRIYEPRSNTSSLNFELPIFQQSIFRTWLKSRCLRAGGLGGAERVPPQATP